MTNIPDLQGDIQITPAGSSTPVRYPLSLDKKTGLLSWNEGQPVNNQEGQPEIPVTAAWPFGTPGGMGETKRTSENSLGNAFTVGVDASGFGFQRLTGYAPTVAPTNLPVDLPTFGFEHEGSVATPATVTEFPLASGSATGAATLVSQRSLTSGRSQTSAITQSLLVELNSTTVGTSFATGSFTPTPNRLVFATVASHASSGATAAPTGLSGNSLTWVQVASSPSLSPSGHIIRISVYRGQAASTSAGALTATFAANQDTCKISVSEFANTIVDTAGNGALAVIQSITGATPASTTTTSLSLTFASAFTSSTNATFGAFAFWQGGTAAVTTITQASGFTEISDLNTTGGFGASARNDMETQWKPSSNTFVSATTTQASGWTGIGIEIAQGSGSSQLAFTTDPFTPGTGTLILLAVDGINATAVAPSSVAGFGLTWTAVQTQQYSGTGRSISVYRASGTPSPTTGSVTITYASAQDSLRWSVVEFLNVDTATNQGVVQSAKTSSAGATSLSVTLSAFGNSNNATYGAFATNGSAGITPGSGFTEMHDVVSGGNLETEWKTANDTGVDASDTLSTSVAWGGIALEIKAASGGIYVTSSIIPTTGRLVLCAVYNNAGTPATPTMSGCGVTWTQVATATVSTFRTTVFRACGLDNASSPAPVAGVLMFDFGAAQTAVRYAVQEFGNVDTTTNQGVVQSASNTSASATSLTVTLSAFAATTNAAFGAFGAAATAGISPEAGFTEIYEVIASSAELETEWKAVADTSVSVSSSDTAGGTSLSYDASSTGTPTGATLTHTWNHTCGATANLLMVGFTLGTVITDDVTLVTYNGATMTLVGKAREGAGAGTASYCYLYKLVNPSTGSALPIVVTTSSLASLRGGASSFIGAGTVGTAVTGNGGNTSTDPMSLTVTSAAGAIVMGTFGVPINATWTAGSGETERWDANSTGVCSTGVTEAGAASVVINPTITGSAQAWAGVAVSIANGGGSAVAWTGVALEIAAGTAQTSGTGAAFIYALNGPYSTKMSRSSTTITVQEQKLLGALAQAGHPAKYGTQTLVPRYYIPAGQNEKYWRLISVGAAGVSDTWEQDTTYYSQAFAVTVQGANASLVRGSDGNKVSLSTDGSTFGSQFDVGNKSETITSMEDSGTVLLVATDSNLHEFDTSGTTRKLTRFSVADKSSTFGSGLMVPSGAEVGFFNHRGLYFWNGTQAIPNGPDANMINRAIPGVTHEPFRGQHLETVYASDEWIYSAYKVTDSGTTKTYIMGGQRNPGSDSIIWHTYARFDGTVHLVPINGALDSTYGLWFAWVGIGYGRFQLGTNGEPDSGRDNYGFGAASTTYDHYYPRTDFGYPHTLKQLRAIEIKTVGLDSTTPLQLGALRDFGSPETVSSTITAAGLSTKFWTLGTNDTCYDATFYWEIATTSGYLPASSDPQVYSLFVRASLRPTMTRSVEFEVDTRRPYANAPDGTTVSNAIDDPLTMRSNLRALVNAAPCTVLDPNGNSLYLFVTELDETAVKGENDSVHYILKGSGYVWVAS